MYQSVETLHGYTHSHLAAYLQGTEHLKLQILAPHEETSVLTQLANLPDDSDIEGAAGKLQWLYSCHKLSESFHMVALLCVLGT